MQARMPSTASGSQGLRQRPPVTQQAAAYRAVEAAYSVAACSSMAASRAGCPSMTMR